MSQINELSRTRWNRRGFLRSAGAAGMAAFGGAAFAGRTSGSPATPGVQGGAAAMSPNEDLMQEHALLERVLLVYEECLRRLEGRTELPPDLLGRAAMIIRNFVGQYHEKLEEEHVFPRFEKAGKLTDLVAVLLAQHKSGRALTGHILSLATPAGFADPAGRTELAGALRAFIRMYRPHASREGSVLFPAFRDLVPAGEFGALGDMFEKREHEVLGPEGFEGQVGVVAGLERQLGIYALDQFSPK
jgi:hemerythrin-like domain-containing protein